MYRLRLAATIAVSFAIALLSGCGGETTRVAETARPDSAGATFLSRDTCARCHPEQTAAWRGSHHDLAMQEATEESVLGDFAGATFTYAGTTSTFTRRDGKFFVRTDGRDGELNDYQIAYTFGFEPLQQYLVAFPDGRFQALSVVWDTRPAADGGQRWYHLYPDEAVDHRDPLHWTGVYQNWNQMCAECHSTNLEKGYDTEADSYRTSWSEIDVSCQACHGPGSVHARWAAEIETGAASGDPADGLVVELKDTGGGVWEIQPETGIAQRTAPPSSAIQVEACGRCHSRRSPIVGEYRHGLALLDTHRLALLEEQLYHADGHIRDEVYVYGSFLQSKMYRAGVVCTDCHDPHGLEIPVADATCARCHLAAKFADPGHHFHQVASAAASCVECHMPARDYMGIDARRDHGFRVPRPDLSLELGTPNACNDCHRDRSTEWAARAFAEWYGDVASRRPHFASALDAGRRGVPEARRLLADLAADAAMPGIARGTALALARRFPHLADVETLRAGLEDPDPLVRLGALQGTEGLDPPRWARPQWLELLAPSLTDPVRAVRIEAGRLLAQVPRERVTPELLPALSLALAEYRDAQQANADRPDGQLNLGLLYSRQGRLGEAERAYRRALALDPWFGPALINLADLYRATERDAQAETLLREAVERLPDDPAARHSLGLTLVRQGRHEEALDELKRALELAPEQTRYAYVYGVALHSRGETGRGLEVLAAAHRRSPEDADLLIGLATLSRDAGHMEEAREYANRLLALRPGDPGARTLVEELSD